MNVLHQILPLALRALNGGLFVVAFALIAEGLKPKRFAGLFSAAPSVALANLTVTVIAKGHAAAIAASRGMTVGALAFALSCVAGLPFLRRWGAVRGALVIAGTWVAAAVAGYFLVLAP